MQSKSEIKNYVRGGQIVLHNYRMFSQITIRVVGISILLMGLMVMAYGIVCTSPYEHYVVWKWLLAKISILMNHHAELNFTQPDGETYKVYASDILASHEIASIMSRVTRVFWQGTLMSFLLYGLAAWAGIFWLKRRGESHLKDKFIAGDRVDTVKAVKKCIREDRTGSKIKLGKDKLPLIKSAENQHILLQGTTGMGKSTIIREILAQIRDRGDRAIIYDRGGSLAKHFYDEEKDHLMNCLDARAENWSLWA